MLTISKHLHADGAVGSARSARRCSIDYRHLSVTSLNDVIRVVCYWTLPRIDLSKITDVHRRICLTTADVIHAVVRDVWSIPNDYACVSTLTNVVGSRYY